MTQLTQYDANDTTRIMETRVFVSGILPRKVLCMIVLGKSAHDLEGGINNIYFSVSMPGLYTVVISLIFFPMKSAYSA